MMKLNEPIAIIIGAIIGAVAVIIVTLIQTCKVQTVKVHLIDSETKKSISGEVFIDADKDGFTSVPESPAVLKIKRGVKVIRAESEGYKPSVVSVKDVVETRNIEMEKIAVAAAVDSKPTPLSLVGCDPWDLKIRTGVKDNEIIVNGTVDEVGGFYKNGLQSVLRGKTLVLYFANVDRSEFNPKSRMVKLTYNKDDTTLKPDNESVAHGGYIPARNTPDNQGIEYPIPDNFDGKLGFVFYQANLKDFKITAYFK